MASKSSFLDKVLGRIGRLDAEGLQTVVQRLARERSFLETLFNTIEDGVLVVDEAGRILYFNHAVTQYLGLQPNVEGQPISSLSLTGKKSPGLTTRAARALRVMNSKSTIHVRAFSGFMPRRSTGKPEEAQEWR